MACGLLVYSMDTVAVMALCGDGCVVAFQPS